MAGKQVCDSSANVINPATEESLWWLRRISKQLEPSSAVDASGRQRVSVESCVVSSGTITTVTTVTTVTTCATVTNVAGFGGVDPRFLLIDTARNAYANGIRANLVFT